MRSSKYFLLLIAVVLPTMASAQDRAPLFPARLGLEAKWDAFQKQPLTAGALAAMLKEDPDGSQVVRWGDARHTSIWAGAQRRVAQDPKLTAELGVSQEREAQTLVEQAYGDLAKLMPIARRLPWADSVHQAIYETGMRELQQGNHGLAARCFQDVLLRSADRELRTRAQVGVFLAAAHEPYAGALSAALHGVDPKATFPLLGKQLTTAEIHARLAAKQSATPPELKTLSKKMLEVPGSASWVFERPIPHPDGILVAGPSLLAWFDGASPKPAWTQNSAQSVSKDLFATMIPGPFVPAMGTNRIYTRWGLQTLAKKVGSATILANVAAFDARTGTQLWSTAANPDWQELTPVNDPTLADGRLYLLAVAQKQEYAPVYLVCLDAQDGKPLWKREIVQNHTTTPGVPRLDVVRFGNPVTVAGGLVYCSTNMGVVACCDARDGVIEWMRSYPQDRAAALSQKLGAAPIAAGARVCFLPRDASLVFALDSASGELVWLKQEEASTALGIFDKSLIVAGPRKLLALEVETGKTVWDRALQGSMDHRAILAGPVVYLGERDKLRRLDARTGAIIEERDAEKSDPIAGFALRDQTLFGTVLSPETKPVVTLPNVASEKSARVVHRHVTPLKLDGKAAEWDLFHPTALVGTSGTRGKLVLTHDDQHLYLGVTTTGGDLRGQRLELRISVDKKTSRWIITPDDQGGVTWEGVDSLVPAGARGAAAQHLVDRTLTFELAIPLTSLLSTKNPKETGWGRLGFDVALRADLSQPAVLTQAHDLFLHRLTADQESAALQLATAFPNMDVSWQILEQGWRARHVGPASTSDFLRDLVKRDPNAPIVSPTLVRLDQLLRKTAAGDPSGEILKLAEEVGVPAPVRAGYKQLAESYLSQWIYVDPTFNPQAIELELFDGATRDHRVVLGTMPPQVAGGGGKPLTGGLKVMSINGKTRVWIGGIEVDPKTRQPLGAAPKAGLESIGKRIMPLPPTGVWHELRIPLLWIDMHDKPIHGIAFQQRGGSHIYWDRTAIVVGGKEHVLLGDALADGLPVGEWRWVDKPIKLGKKSHTMPHPQFKDETVRHAVTFKEGFRAHLVPSPKSAFDPEALVRQHVPQLAPDAHAAAFLALADGLLRLDQDKHQKLRLELLRKAEPAEVVRWLDLLHAQEIKQGEAKLDALLQQAKLPEETAKAYRDANAKCFVRGWQVIGPFPLGTDHTSPDLESGFMLDMQYKTPKGQLRWSLMESAADRIDLTKRLDKEKAGTVYAACWVHVDAKQPALVRITSADRVQLWINPGRGADPVIDEPFFRQSAHTVGRAVDLQPGWNTVLVRIDSHSGRAAFALEFREKDGSQPLQGVSVHAYPKAANK